LNEKEKKVSQRDEISWKRLASRKSRRSAGHEKNMLGPRGGRNSQAQETCFTTFGSPRVSTLWKGVNELRQRIKKVPTKKEEGLLLIC